MTMMRDKPRRSGCGRIAPRPPTAGRAGSNRLVMRFRLAIVRAVCWAFLPRNVWVGKHFGAYTSRWSVHLGRLDNRGVLQGLSDRDAGA